MLDVTPPPTAIFYPSDELAFGGLSVIKERGLRVPEDISLVSFNGTPFAAFTDPPLTSVQVPARELGTMAMQLLIDVTEQRRPIRDVVLGVDLVVRGSAGPPKIGGRRAAPARTAPSSTVAPATAPDG